MPNDSAFFSLPNPDNEAGLTVAAAQQRARAASTAVSQAWQTAAPLPRPALATLCQLATAKDERIATLGVATLFGEIIEPFNDSFDPAAAQLYDQAFAQVLDYCRHLPAGQAIATLLQATRLPNETAILQRRTLFNAPPAPLHHAALKKIILLSRVTIGADVAVTSVLWRGLQQRFPQAEFVMLGSLKLQELWGAAVRVRELSYERGGGLLTRLASWPAVRQAIAAETAALAAHEWLAVDPDSRLTQLGLLPICQDDNYRFFPSRQFMASSNLSIAELAGHWCQQLCAPTDVTTDVTNDLSDNSWPATHPVTLTPQLALPQAAVQFGQTVCAKLRRTGAPRLLALSFGVGGNERKRVSETFETRLLQALQPQATLIIDKGGNAAERAQIDQLLAAFAEQGKRVIELNQVNAAHWEHAPEITADIVTWDGGIGQFAGLIAASDQYLGYDSAGQHIAAALGVPTVTLFVNNNTPRFAARWRPCGQGKVTVIAINAAAPPPTDQLLTTVLQAVNA